MILKIIRSQIEVRQALNIPQTTAKRYFKALIDLEYVYLEATNHKTGYLYSIRFWDDLQKLKTEIKSMLLGQLKSR